MISAAAAEMSVPAVSNALDTCANAAGARLDVADYPSRETRLQRADDDTASLIVMFHGMNGCVKRLQDVTELDATAAVHVLWVTGGLGTRSRASWNIVAGTDDAYVIAAISAALLEGIKPRTINSVGISNGAGMAVFIACRFPETFSSAISVASWQPGQFVCQNAASSLFVATGSRDLYAGIDTNKQLTSMWRSQALCSAQSVSTTETVFVIDSTWSGCSRDVVVRQVIAFGIGHQWLNVDGFDLDNEILLFVNSLPSPIEQLPAVK